jgi:hypothetical protein
MQTLVIKYNQSVSTMKRKEKKLITITTMNYGNFLQPESNQRK